MWGTKEKLEADNSCIGCKNNRELKDQVKVLETRLAEDRQIMQDRLQAIELQLEEFMKERKSGPEAKGDTAATTAEAPTQQLQDDKDDTSSSAKKQTENAATSQTMKSAKTEIKKTSPSNQGVKKRRLEIEEAEVKGSDNPEDKIAVLGSSNVRFIGQRLTTHSDSYVSICHPGGHIEDSAQDFRMANKEVGTVVVEVGTNNLISDSTEEMMKKYRQLIKELKDMRLKRIVMMGILPRKNSKLEFKRRTTNRQLRQMCEDEGVDYLEVRFNAWMDQCLGKDGLHLNFKGADMTARRIYREVQSLNSKTRQSA
jgi:hypothetical protein